MNNEKHQRRLKTLLKFGKKNRFCRIVALILVFFDIAFYHLIQKIYNNRVRISLSLSAFIFFFMFGSFVFKDNSSQNKSDVMFVSQNISSGDDKYELTYAENFSDNNDISNVDSDSLTDADLDETMEENFDENIDGQDEAQFYSADELILDTDYKKLSKETNKTNIVSLKEFKKSDWNLVLVNKQHPIPDDYSFELTDLKKGMKCDERVAPYLISMIMDAKDAGINLVLCSPYRNYDRQVMLFNKKIDKYMKKGYSYSESYLLTSQAVTVPGSSEHQIGISFDIVAKDYTVLNSGFANTDAGKWLAEHCIEYGFIIRYPEGKEDITGIEYEPWHFRYVGVDAAKYINDYHLTLEEFVDLIEE